MTEDDIAYKYVHGLHDALTDSQEKIDMANDIINFAKEYHNKQLRIGGVSKSVTCDCCGESDIEWYCNNCYEEACNSLLY
jgi:hypothetical protein